MARRFWEERQLEDLTEAEWESLCDGCGKCCLVKLEDEDNGDIHFTTVACRLFDEGLCACTDYADRKRHVPDCVKLTPQNVRSIPWLPASCAYRLVAEGRPLPDWHHLVSGDRGAIHHAGASMQGRITAMEQDIADDEEYFLHMLDEAP